MKKLTTLLWRALFLGVLVLVLVAVIKKDRNGLTTFNRIQDKLTSDDWVGWIHPLGTGIARALDVGPFDSLAECEDYSWSYIQKKYEGFDNSAFFCGYSCSDTDYTQRDANCKLVR